MAEQEVKTKKIMLTISVLQSMNAAEREICIIEIAEVQHLLRSAAWEWSKVQDTAVNLAAAIVYRIPTEVEIQNQIEQAREIVRDESEKADWHFASNLLKRDIYRSAGGVVPIFVRENFVVPKFNPDNVTCIDQEKASDSGADLSERKGPVREGADPSIPFWRTQKLG